MSDFDRHTEWAKLTELLSAISTIQRELATSVYEARLNECVRIDSNHKEAVKNGCQDWVSQEIRSRYLASIMRGSILIGS